MGVESVSFPRLMSYIKPPDVAASHAHWLLNHSCVGCVQASVVTVQASDGYFQNSAVSYSEIQEEPLQG